MDIRRSYEEENRRLKRELEVMRQERDILKKVVSIPHSVQGATVVDSTLVNSTTSAADANSTSDSTQST